MSISRIPALSGALMLALGALAGPAQAEPAPKMKKAGEMIRRQQPAQIYKQYEALVTPETSRVYVNLTKQRVYLMTGETVYIDSPISSGKAVGMTPTGKFTILEKDPNHRSNIYGEFVDASNRTVRAGVSLKVDSAPSGTHYVGAPMRWFMRLTELGVGMHVGILPGYPASHGCVRLPADIAPLIYQKVKVGTPVQIDP